jgi:hypothetical protein
MPLPQILVPEQISEYKKVLKEEKSKQNAYNSEEEPTVWPLRIQPSIPPFSLDGQIECSVAKSLKSTPEKI